MKSKTPSNPETALFLELLGFCVVLLILGSFILLGLASSMGILTK